MSNQSNMQRGLFIAAETMGLDPGAIVGRDNLLPSPTNINAWGGIPSQPDRAPDVQQREMNWSDKSAPPYNKPPGARGYRGASSNGGGSSAGLSGPGGAGEGFAEPPPSE